MRVYRVESVLGIDKGRLPTAALCRGNHMERQGGLSRRLWAVYLNHATAWHATHTERRIESQGAAWNNRDIQGLTFSQTHDGTFAVLLFNLRQGQVERPLFFVTNVSLRLLHHDTLSHMSYAATLLPWLWPRVAGNNGHCRGARTLQHL
jgi:hypothetical protein